MFFDFAQFFCNFVLACFIWEYAKMKIIDKDGAMGKAMAYIK